MIVRVLSKVGIEEGGCAMPSRSFLDRRMTMHQMVDFLGFANDLLEQRFPSAKPAECIPIPVSSYRSFLMLNLSPIYW
jgi:hypothetical protein